jgi:multidrug efflux pump subunit AcrB
MGADDAIPADERRGFFAQFIQNHVAATLVALSFAVAGIVVLTTGQVRREVFPEIEPNVVTVQVVYPSASPQEIEHGICERIEEAIDGIAGIDRITSTANEGVGLVVVETLQDADVETVLDDVRTRVDGIPNLPAGAEDPIVSRLVLRKEVVNVAVAGDLDEATLRRVAERARDALAALPQISQVELAAVRPWEVSIEVGEAELQRHGLTLGQVAEAVRRGSLDLPGGALRTADGDTMLRVVGQAYDREQFAQLPLLTAPDGSRILLGDVARIVDGFADQDLEARFDGRPTALLKVFRVGEQDAIAVTDAVRRWVAGDGQALLPPGCTLTTWRDESVILRSRIDLLLRNAAQGLLLVFVILTLFLQMRLAIWVAIGIPIAFLGAAAVMPVFDVSVNMISVFAFLLVLGIVVDDAIVVGENVMQRRRRGDPPMLASLRGAREVRHPVFASVLTTITAFLPMLFSVPGSDAQVWRVIPLIVVPVLVVSLIESQLCLPAHLAMVGRAHDPGRGWIGTRVLGALQRGVDHAVRWFVERLYQPFVGAALRWRYVTVATAVVLLALGVACVRAGLPRFIFFPTVEGDNIVVSLTMPAGTPIATTSSLLARIEAAARDVCAEFDEQSPSEGGPVLQHMLATVGAQPYSAEQARNAGQRDAQFDSGAHLAELNVQLVPSEQRTPSSDAIMSRLRERVGTIPDATALTFTTSFFSTGKDIDVALYHDDMTTLRAAVAELEHELRRLPDVKDVQNSWRTGKRELELAVTPAAEAIGIDQRELAHQVRQAFHGEEAQRIQRGRDDVKVMVRYPEDDRRSASTLDAMRIRTPAGDEVPLHEVATAEARRSPTTITRVDRRRSLRVSGDIDENDPDASAEAVNDILRERVLPDLVSRFPGLRFDFEGDQKKKTDLLVSLAGGFLIALFLIYALMAIPLHSFVQPLMIMTAIPFGFVGALGGHLITGHDLSILSMFGVVALAGIVVNDNIVLVDWINRQRAAGAALLDAVLTAGAARFRPILLTSLTTFGGLLPLLLERSVQARFLVPMAVSLAFGVMFATTITLVLVPALYLVVEDLRRNTARFVRFLLARG